MKKHASATQLTKSQALTLTPVKNMDAFEVVLDSGVVVIHYPVTMRPWMAKWIQRFKGSSPQTGSRKLQLDTLGTQVWKMIDGKRTVRDIVDSFARTHQLERREAETAVTQFLRDLGKRGLVGMRE
ncbi:MAG: PqqD family protein [Deltaproteobacteria bacterium]|nr:PqqD family protein [Deltaproteobacteria bacterium]